MNKRAVIVGIEMAYNEEIKDDRAAEFELLVALSKEGLVYPHSVGEFLLLTTEEIPESTLKEISIIEREMNMPYDRIFNKILELGYPEIVDADTLEVYAKIVEKYTA